MIQLLKNFNILLQQNKFQPTFYWTGDIMEDAERINRPHINAEGPAEDRIQETIEIIKIYLENPDFDGVIDTIDIFNIQNYFLKKNNYKGIKSGFRDHGVSFNSPNWEAIPELFYRIVPVSFKRKEDLLLWYTVMQKIHPLSDLNGRVFGVVVAILYSYKCLHGKGARPGEFGKPMICEQCGEEL